MEVCYPALSLSLCASVQILPGPGSKEEFELFVLDAGVTGLFNIELFINIFAHSNNGFKPFYSRGSNCWCFFLSPNHISLATIY